MIREDEELVEFTKNKVVENVELEDGDSLMRITFKDGSTLIVIASGCMDETGLLDWVLVPIK